MKKLAIANLKVIDIADYENIFFEDFEKIVKMYVPQNGKFRAYFNRIMYRYLSNLVKRDAKSLLTPQYYLCLDEILIESTDTYYVDTLTYPDEIDEKEQIIQNIDVQHYLKLSSASKEDASKVNPSVFRIVSLRMRGYKLREIHDETGIPMTTIKRELDKAKSKVPLSKVKLNFKSKK